MKKMLITALVSVFFAPFVTAGEVNVVSWGGAYTESQKLGYGCLLYTSDAADE